MTTATDANDTFEVRLPEIERLAGFQFRHLHPEARQEAIQNSVVLAYRYWGRLAGRGKVDEGCFRNAIWWACLHTRMGRRGAGPGGKKAKCVLDYARRRRDKVAVEGGVDLDGLVGRSTSVPDAVAFRLDTPAFLASLPERDRGIALALAAGKGTAEVARERGVTPGAISQARTRLRKRYDEFHAAI